MNVEVVAGILRNDQGQVLLLRRQNTGRHDGEWDFPMAEVGSAETDVTAMRHEMLSTLGIRVDPSGADRVSAAEDEGELLTGFVFTAWRGRIVNLRGRYISAVRWFDPGHLPSLTPRTRRLMYAWESG